MFFCWTCCDNLKLLPSSIVDLYRIFYALRMLYIYVYVYYYCFKIFGKFSIT